MRSLLSLLLISATAFAPALADIPGKTSVAVRASTLGLGIELSHELPVTNLSGRLGFNSYTHEMNQSIEGIPYDLDFELGSVVAMLDWKPWGTFTHFTAGLVFNGNQINARSQAAAMYTVGGMTYSAADVGNLSGTAKFDSVVPYAGLGWKLPIFPKTALTFELGLVMQGSPKISLEASGLLATDPVFQQELAAETAQFQNDIEDYKYYPVIALGLSRRF